MTLTNSLIDEEMKRTGGNLSKVSRALGLDYHALKERQLRLITTARNMGLNPATAPIPEDISRLGRPGFQHNVIAVKRQGDVWPARFSEALADARRKFDAGTHEMFQTSDNGWTIQYLLPRLTPAGRRNFFNTMEFAV